MGLLGNDDPLAIPATTGDRWARSALGVDPALDPSILGFTIGPADPYAETPTAPVIEKQEYQQWLYSLGIPGYVYGGPDPLANPELYPEWNPDPEIIELINLTKAPEPKRLLWPILAAIGLVLAAKEGIL